MVSSTPRPHFTPGKDTVAILQEAGWAPGPVWTGGKSRPHWYSIPDRLARSQSLYRLSYSAHTHRYICIYISVFIAGMLHHVNWLADTDVQKNPSAPESSVSINRHSVTPKKILTFSNTAERTSNLARRKLIPAMYFS